MPDELRLRRMVYTADRHATIGDEAFIIGGQPNPRGDGWVGGRVVCHFGEDDYRASKCGKAPSPEDTRRMELCWNTHKDLVEACEAALGFSVNARQTWPDWADHPDIGHLYTKMQAILAKVKCPENERKDDGGQAQCR